MKLEIRFLDDEGNVILEHKGQAEHPSQWKAQDKIIAGQYEIYAFSYQPHVRCLYPNGQPPPVTPPTSPFTGQGPVMNTPNYPSVAPTLSKLPFADMPGFKPFMPTANRLGDPTPYKGDDARKLL